jgi:hypothetical protein
VKKILWLAVGVGIGFFAAHQFSKTPRGQQFFDDVDAKAHEFSSAVIDGYRAREAELRSAVADAEDALDNLRSN